MRRSAQRRRRGKDSITTSSSDASRAATAVSTSGRSPTLKGIEDGATADRMPTLGELCEMVGGPCPASGRDQEPVQRRHAPRAATGEAPAASRGPVAAMWLHAAVVASAPRDFTKAPALNARNAARRKTRPPSRCREGRATPPQSGWVAGPQFLAYDVDALTHCAAPPARKLLRRPLLTWTVTTPAPRQQAALHADQYDF